MPSLATNEVVAAVGESAAVFAPPPTSDPSRHGSPADARRACPSAGGNLNVPGIAVRRIAEKQILTIKHLTVPLKVVPYGLWVLGSGTESTRESTS
jgi:hypothetical protein